MSSSDGSSSPAGEIQLSLGLSLGGGGMISPHSAARGEHRRFLSARDFPSTVPDRGSSSADPASPCPIRAVSGTKRAADSAAQEAASSPSSAVSQVVGWPPVRAYRINSLVMNQAKPLARDGDDKLACAENYKFEDPASKKKAHNAASVKEKNPHLGFVKVNVDGLPIGRKVDLNAHASYETLALALEDMFFTPANSITSTCSGGMEQARKPLKLLDGLSEFVLVYKDREGDWMLVGDVPWEMFLGNVRRLRIMRTSEANGLST